MSFLDKKNGNNPEMSENNTDSGTGKSNQSKVKYNARPLEINLLTYKQETSDESNRMVIGALILVLVLLLGMGVHYKLNYDKLADLKSNNLQLTAERDRLQRESGFSSSYQNLVAVLNSKQQNIKSLETQKIYFSKVINEVAGVIPNGVNLTGMKLASGTLGLSGFAGDYGQVASFVSGLREKPMFKKVTLASCGKGSNSSQVQFTIETGWEAVQQ